MIYRSFVLPTLETQEYMSTLFQGAPMFIDVNSFGVELGSSRSPFLQDQLRTYRALPGLMNKWYDPSASRSYWILPLIPSPEMAARAEQVGDAWGRQFVPFIVITEVQNLVRRNVAFMNSIASGLVSSRPILTFHNEFVVEDASVMPRQQAFYDDYLARGSDADVVFPDIASDLT